MAIKFEVYLKRTEQSIEDWLRLNEVTKLADFLPRCAYIGLTASSVDIAAAAQILEKKLLEASPSKVEDSTEKKQKKKKVVDELLSEIPE